MYPYFEIFGKQFSSYGVLAVIGGIACLIYTLIRAKQKKLNMNDLLYDVALTQLFMVGPRTARTLIEHLGSAEAVFKETPDALRTRQNLDFRYYSRR